MQISPLVRSDDDVSKVRAGDSAYYWWLFPNLMVNLHPDSVMSYLVYPNGPARTTVVSGGSDSSPWSW